MIRILAIDMDFHQRTASSNPLLDVLCQLFSADAHYLHHGYTTRMAPSLCEGHQVLADCRALTCHACWCGVEDILDTQYFRNSVHYPNMVGDPCIVRLWARGAIFFDAVRKLFCPEGVKKVRILRRKEERVTRKSLLEADVKRWKVHVIETGFVDEVTYFEQIRYEKTIPISFSLVHPLGVACDEDAEERNELRLSSYISRGLTVFGFCLGECWVIQIARRVGIRVPQLFELYSLRRYVS